MLTSTFDIRPASSAASARTWGSLMSRSSSQYERKMRVSKVDCIAEPATSYAFEISRCALSVILVGPANELMGEAREHMHALTVARYSKMTHRLMPTASPRSIAIRLHDSHLSRPSFFLTNSFLVTGSTGRLG